MESMDECPDSSFSRCVVGRTGSMLLRAALGGLRADMKDIVTVTLSAAGGQHAAHRAGNVSCGVCRAESRHRSTSPGKMTRIRVTDAVSNFPRCGKSDRHANHASL